MTANLLLPVFVMFPSHNRNIAAESRLHFDRRATTGTAIHYTQKIT